MRIFQLLPSLSFGDAVGNDTLAMKELIASMGVETEIYALDIGKKLPEKCAKNFLDMPEVAADDIVIYHMASACEPIHQFLLKAKCHKIMLYHNITPGKFYEPYDPIAFANVTTSRRDLVKMKDTFEMCITVSDYNKQDLREAGYTCPIIVMPILIPFEDYKKQPDNDVIAKYKDGWTNIMFLGRIAPNKCYEDIIAAYAMYKKYINPQSRLLLVGNTDGTPRYYDRLQRYVDAIGVEDVIFTGHTSFPAILAYYKVADVFLCMSEHEGFCVPLVEAMTFDVPIIAYNSSAIPWTLGQSGIVLDNKKPDEVACAIDYLLTHSKLKQSIILKERERLADFAYNNVGELGKKILSTVIKGEDISRIDEISFARNVSSADLALQEAIPVLLKKYKLQQLDIQFADIPLTVTENSHVDSELIEQTEVVTHSILRSGYNIVCKVSPRTAEIIKRALKKFIKH